MHNFPIKGLSINDVISFFPPPFGNLFEYIQCGPTMLAQRKFSRDPLKTLCGGLQGYLDFLAKSLIIPATYLNLKIKFVSYKLKN